MILINRLTPHSLFFNDSLEADNNDGFTAAPTPDNIMIWNAVIFG